MDLARHFDVVIGGGSVAARKPDPRPVLAALEGLGAERGSAVMVGDGRNDVLTARRAGMAVVVVSYGYNGGVRPEHPSGRCRTRRWCWSPPLCSRHATSRPRTTRGVLIAMSRRASTRSYRSTIATDDVIETVFQSLRSRAAVFVPTHSHRIVGYSRSQDRKPKTPTWVGFYAQAETAPGRAES
jgi:hypothetical protein